MLWLDKQGVPVDFYPRHHRVLNLLRWLLHVSVRTSIKQRDRWQLVRGLGGYVDTWCPSDSTITTEAEGGA